MGGLCQFDCFLPGREGAGGQNKFEQKIGGRGIFFP